jgi:hypothetical protein
MAVFPLSAACKQYHADGSHNLHKQLALINTAHRQTHQAGQTADLGIGQWTMALDWLY